MDDVSGSRKNEDKNYEAIGRSASLCPFGGVGQQRNDGRHRGRESITKVFSCKCWTASLPVGKRKSGPPSKKSRPLWRELAGKERDNGLSFGFSVSVSSRSSRSVIYWGTVPGPFPRSGGRRSRNRLCIPRNGCLRHPEPQGPDECRACRGQRRRNRPACP